MEFAEFAVEHPAGSDRPDLTTDFTDLTDGNAGEIRPDLDGGATRPRGMDLIG